MSRFFVRLLWEEFAALAVLTWDLFGKHRVFLAAIVLLPPWSFSRCTSFVVWAFRNSISLQRFKLSLVDWVLLGWDPHCHVVWALLTAGAITLRTSTSVAVGWALGPGLYWIRVQPLVICFVFIVDSLILGCFTSFMSQMRLAIIYLIQKNRVIWVC